MKLGHWVRPKGRIGDRIYNRVLAVDSSQLRCQKCRKLRPAFSQNSLQGRRHLVPPDRVVPRFVFSYMKYAHVAGADCRTHDIAMRNDEYKFHTIPKELKGGARSVDPQHLLENWEIPK